MSFFNTLKKSVAVEQARVWTEQQQQIFEWFRVPTAQRSLVVRARAGTGKTTTIIEALKYAPEARRSSVLLAAFNKNIAYELSRRVPPGVEAKTIHSLGFGALRKRFGKIELNEDKGKNLARAVCASASREGEEATWEMIENVFKLVSIAKSTLGVDMVDLEALLAHYDCGACELEPKKIMGLALDCMEEAKNLGSSREIDYDDMIWLPNVLGIRPPFYDLVIIDEAQDMNPAQLALVKMAVKPGGRICIVGDDRQAIYGFRGAEVGALDLMKEELQAVEMPLQGCFRCPEVVIECAQGYVPDIHAQNTKEGNVFQIPFHALPDEFLGDREAERDIFVLSRSNAGAVEACLLLRSAGVKAYVLGQDIGKMLKAVIRRFKAKRLDDLIAQLATWTDEEVKKHPHRATDFLDKQRTIIELSEGLSTKDELWQRIEETFKDETTGIPCSTVHKVKGQEARWVYILSQTFFREGEGEEEDNLRYVAITRAAEDLTFVEMPERGRGDDDFPKPHPFIEAGIR